MLNYLEKGNYFFIYDQATNLLNLTYYKGVQTNIVVLDIEKAVGNFSIYITNSTNISS